MIAVFLGFDIAVCAAIVDFSTLFVLYDSLGGGGSESLLNDAQGKTHAQTLLSMEIDFPEKMKDLINE